MKRLSLDLCAVATVVLLVSLILAPMPALGACDVVVAPSGGNFSTITDALAALTPTAEDPCVVHVEAGTYVENITMKSFVRVQRAARPGGEVLVMAMDSALPIITLDGHTEVVIAGLTLWRGGTAGVFLTNASQLTITDSQLSGSRVGIDNRNSSVTVTGSIITNNGEGVWNTGTMTLSHTTVSGNPFFPCFANPGAGIRNGGTMSITHSTIAGNCGVTAGGILNGGTLTITNSTVARNAWADDFSNGGIISSGTLKIVNSTIADNVGAMGAGGLRVIGGTATLENTILAGNESAVEFEDCLAEGTLVSQGHNLIGAPSVCHIRLRPSDLTGYAGLAGFANDGIPGHGHIPLLPDSPAIDAANPASCPPTDQLDRRRLGICDMGAVEFRP